MGKGRKWAYALAIGILLAQAVVIGILVTREDGDVELTPLSGRDASRGNLQVTFVETAPEIEIRALLAETGAQIVDGPGALGIYRLRVAPDRLAQAEQRLRQAPQVVASVSRVE